MMGVVSLWVMVMMGVTVMPDNNLKEGKFILAHGLENSGHG